jgi:catechol 2,3-dioxygenase-like lactoylglutathione lyase family enzyme
MQQLIEKMVADFESGKLSRRQFAVALAGLVAAGANAASTSDLKAVGVNHVTLRVRDVLRSTKFYQDVFGMPMRKSSPTVNILSLNANCFFGIEAANEKEPAVDHFSLAIQNFKSAEAAAKLEKRGLKLAGVSNEGLKFIEPDGMLVQLNAPDYPGYLPNK